MSMNVLNLVCHLTLETWGRHSLYCGKWKKISKPRCDFDLDRTMPNVELVANVAQCTQTDRHTHTHTDRQTDTHTHTHKHTNTQTDMSTL